MWSGRWIGAGLCLVLTVTTVQPSAAQASPFHLAMRDIERPGGSELTPAIVLQPPPDTSQAEVELDPADAEARAAYETGKDAYALGKYEQAVGYFERCFELTQRPELLFNIGQAYSRWYEVDPKIEHLRKGKKLLQNYLAYLEAQGEFDPTSAADARTRIQEIDDLILAHEARDSGSKKDKKLAKKGWFWAVVVGGVALVAGGVTLGVVLSRRDQGDGPELGTIGAGGPGAGAEPASGALLRF